MVNIDWTRVAKPQDDGYDVAVLDSLDWAAFGWQKKVPQTPVTLGDGTIGICKARINMSMGDAVDVGDSLTSDWAQEQNRYLRAWSAGYRALTSYVDEFWPWRSPGSGGKGCSSGHLVMSKDRPYHAVYVTMNDPQGCAQGIYHEMAHLRLRTLGIQMETHTGMMLTNADTELYDSPVRFDVKRPMPAVLQGLYAWLMFIENDWQLYHAGICEASDFRQYTFHNLPKIANGIREVKTYAKTTPAGADFLRGLYDWSDDLLDRCHADAKIILGPVEYERRFGSQATST